MGYRGILNPSIIRLKDELLNLYSGFNGKTWHTGLATSAEIHVALGQAAESVSPNPATWEGNYIAANGSALGRNGQILYWYQAGDPPRIALAHSNDARSWIKDPKPVLEHCPTGSWDERGVAIPSS